MARILVIDDDPVVANSISKTLQRAGHEVAVARDGTEAVRLFDIEAADLVITDIYMPEVDGFEIIRTFRRHVPMIPIIAISGGGEWPKETLLETAEYLGVVEAIAKPFALDDLLGAVDRALRGSVGDG